MTADGPAVTLQGSWRLESWLIHYTGNCPPGLPYGSQPQGLLIYSPDGWMSAAVHRKDRPPLPAEQSPRNLEPAVIADSYWSYFHYAGTWRVENDRVIHTVKHSLNPNMMHTEQVRHITLHEPRLTLTGFEAIAGQERCHELTWRRQAATLDFPKIITPPRNRS
jgi:hypothetical protein